MKPQYVIIDKRTNAIRGIIEDKETLDIFKSQRSMELFHVEKNTDKKVIEFLSEDNFVEYVYNTVLFLPELEFVQQLLLQFPIDLNCVLRDLYESLVPLIKLSSEEDDIMLKFIVSIAKHMEECSIEAEESEDYSEVEERYYNMEKFVASSM